MESVEKRYERSGKVKPCFLDQEDLLNLAHIIQETFTRPEIERYFRVSTTLDNTRVFSNSMGDFLVQKELPDKITDMSFWIEGWDQKTRFDKNVLLDFSRYSVQLRVEGTDPVWVFDKFNSIMKFLQHKTAWYWPVIVLEKFIIFSLTMILITSLIVSRRMGETAYYIGEISMLGVWALFIFADTRKIWPYSYLRLRGTESVFSKENFYMLAMLVILMTVILEGVILPFFFKMTLVVTPGLCLFCSKQRFLKARKA